MSDQPKIILPEKYYLDNFMYLIDFVVRKYQDLLNENELAFIRDFKALSQDAQCLYVRMSNRKARFFKASKLNYEEITDIPSAYQELSVSGFSRQEEILAIEEEYQLISIFNKSEIVKKLKSESISIDHKLPKTELALEIVEQVNSTLIYQQFYSSELIYTQAKEEELAMIKLFFFGHNHGDMSDFVIRDIGNAKFMEIDESKLRQSFDTREEAEAIMQLAQLNRDFAVLAESSSYENIVDWFYTVDINYYLSIERAKHRTDKFIHAVGYHLEKAKLFEEALNIYQLSSSSPMRERQIRIYNKQKDFESATTLATEILESPNDNKEYYIAMDVLNKQKLKATTIRQKQGVEIEVPESYKYQVEEGVLQHFESLGYTGVHAENSIWRSIFGLVFWEEIFDPQYNQIYQPLQRDPLDAFSKDFYINRKEAIHQRLDTLRSKKQIAKLIEHNYQTNLGVASMFVNWDDLVFEGALRLIDFLSPKQVKATLLAIAIDPRTRSSGFPDLLIWNDSDYYFYEVKSPTDHLSEKQLFWLEHFKAHKINAEVALVKWT
ncbi:MAG: VRR-NUC domain-containing protein [Reichenbachiella sp.]